MKAQGKVWHRDRIDELKTKNETIRWLTAIWVTCLLGLYSLAYIVYYRLIDDKQDCLRWILVIIMVYLTYKIGKEIKKLIYESNNTSETIRNNFDVILGRKK
ncbi:MAG: hypothetical protein V1859_11395 [archaeon]